MNLRILHSTGGGNGKKRTKSKSDTDVINRRADELIREHNNKVSHYIKEVMGTEDHEQIVIQEPDLEYYDEKSGSVVMPATETEKTERYTWIILSQCNSYDLGSLNRWPDTKCCPLRCRDVRLYVTARLCHPSLDAV